jgi:hypothetical protein
MIDYFDITVEGGNYPRIGKTIITTHPSGMMSHSTTEVVACAAKGAPYFKVQVDQRERKIRFWGSPSQYLQCHNGMGSNDFRALVSGTIPLIFESLKIKYPKDVSKAIDSGQYEVHEVHVAEQYRMPHPLIFAFCDNIRRYANSSLEVTPLDKGMGIRLYPNSRDRQVLLYDKYHYFMDGLSKHKTKLLGNMPMSFDRFGTSLEFDQMMEQFLAIGIRIETRFMRCLKSKANPFNRGAHWKPETARQLHRQMLHDIPLADVPKIHLAEQMMTEPNVEYRTMLALWLAGREPRQFCNSAPTYYRRRNAILDRHGVDLSVPFLPDAGIGWKDVIAEDALMEPPAWALESGFVYEPSRWIDYRHPSLYERAWLHPVQEWIRTSSFARRKQEVWA